MGQNKFDKKFIVIIVLVVLLIGALIIGGIARSGNGGGVFGGGNNDIYEKTANLIFDNEEKLGNLNTIFANARDNEFSLTAIFSEDFSKEFADMIESNKKVYDEIKDLEFDSERKGGADLIYIQEKIKDRKEFYEDTLNIYNELYTAYKNPQEIDTEAANKLAEGNDKIAKIVEDLNFVITASNEAFDVMKTTNCLGIPSSDRRCKIVVDNYTEKLQAYKDAKAVNEIFAASKLYRNELIGEGDDVQGRIGALKIAMEKKE